EQKMKSYINPIKEVTVKKGIPYPRGKVWGGCSSLNGIVYMQYNDWAAQGSEYKIWNWDHCLEGTSILIYSNYFIRKYTRTIYERIQMRNLKKIHGFNGLLHMQDHQNRVYDIMSDLIDAVKNLGIPYNNDFNSERQNSVGRYQTTNEKEKKCSLADVYFRDALKKVKFHPDVRLYAHVLEIIWNEENKKENIATSVRYFCNSTVREAFIAPKGEVII
ncbi:45853_t:CDS:2, partial [Gigaspora margarita]